LPLAFDTPDAADPSPTDERPGRLKQLADEVSRCNRCPGLFATRTQTVFGTGPLSPEVCFIGDAPGAEDDRTGTPFTGEAGELFDKMLTKMGFNRTEVYLCLAVKCRPPGNRTPTETECGNCREYLNRQLELVRPRFICCLGQTVARTLLNRTDGLNALRSAEHEFAGIPVVVTYNPAYLLQNKAARWDCWEDLKKLLKRIGRPLPGEGG
jgi:DNA polymerase